MIIRVKELEYFYIQESIYIMLPRAAERGGQRGGELLRASRFWGPLEFFCLNISEQRARYLGFFGKVPKFGMRNLGKVAGKQLQRTGPEKFSPKKRRRGPKIFFQEKFLK
jgi:hypothetical protein